MQKLKKIKKFFLWLGIAIITFLLLVALVLQSPSIQKKLTTQLSHYLQNKLQTKVEIDAIHLKLPQSLSLKGFYVEDQKKDTLLKVGELLLNFKLNKLFSKKIQFDQITLKNGVGDLYFARDSSNFDFIINAFSNKVVKDSSQKETPKNKNPENGNPWLITFDDAQISLEHMAVDFWDKKAGIKLGTNLGRLIGEVEQIDYGNHQYDIKKLLIADAHIQLDLDDGEEGESSDTEAPTYRINATDLALEKVHFELNQSDLHLDIYTERLAQEVGAFYLKGDSIALQAEQYYALNSHVKYDVPNSLLQQGFDYNHFEFQNLNFNLEDFTLLFGAELNIKTNILNASGNERDNLKVEALETKFDLSEEALHLQNIFIKTDKSILEGEVAQFYFPPSEANFIINELDVKADFKNLNDVSYFYPDLDSLYFIKEHLLEPVKVNAKMEGTLEDLHFSYLDLEGYQSSLSFHGHLKNIAFSDQMHLEINELDLGTHKEILASFLPDSLSFAYKLPDSVQVNGQIIGSLHHLQTNLNAQLFRKDSIILAPSIIKTAATFLHLNQSDSTYLDIQLDTVYTSKRDLLAYLPPNTLPESINLPEELTLKGSIKGRLNNLNSNLQLLTLQKGLTNEIIAYGNVAGLFTNRQPSFNFNLKSNQIDKQSIENFIPQNMLPDYFELPLIKKMTGFFKGNLEDFTTNFQFNSNAGQWGVVASLDEEKYQLDLNVADLEPDSLLTAHYSDSLLGFSFQTLDLSVQVKGEGFNFSESSVSDIYISIKKAKEDALSGLIINGKLEQQKLKLEASIKEEIVDFRGDLSLDYTTNVPKWDWNTELYQLQLDQLNVSKLPFTLNGSMKGTAYGADLNALLIAAKAEAIQLQFDQQSEKIEHIDLSIALDSGKNEILINSDFLDASLKGNFEYPRILKLLNQHLFSMIDPNYPDALIGKTTDQFEFQLDLHRPEILTMGFISTLEKLATFRANIAFDNENLLWKGESKIPFIRYQNSSFENITILTESENRTLKYEFGFDNSDVLDMAKMRNFSSVGILQNQILENNTTILDDKKERRFAIKSGLQFLGNQNYYLSLFPDQLLNYENWQVTRNNALQFGKDGIRVADWRISNEDQAISIHELDEGQFAFQFKQFNLKTISNILEKSNYDFSGILNGNIFIKEISKQLPFNADLRIDSLKISGENYGNFDLIAQSEHGDEIQLKSSLIGNGNNLELSGLYDRKEEFEPMDFQLKIAALNLSSIEPFVADYLEKMKGQLNGALQITGSFDAPALIGQVQLKDAALDIIKFKTHLKLGPQAIVFDANAIEFQNLEISDKKGSKGILSSYILTSDYRDFYFQSDVEVTDFLVLNTTEKDNDLYHGQLRVDAQAKLTGNLKKPIIEINAKPKKGSDLIYIYGTYSNKVESHEGIVEFVNTKKESNIILPNQQLVELSDNLNLKIIAKIQVDKDLKFKAITNPLTGDYLKVEAKGDLVYTQYPDGEMEVNGELEVEKGEYLFTYQNLIRRAFNIAPGGTIKWTGDPFNPKLDMNVIYKVKTSTHALFSSQGGEANSATSKGKQTFHVILNIKGAPTKPEILTSIAYPEAEGNTNDTDVQSAIDVINRDLGLKNTQAFSLILFNGFIAQDFGQSQFQALNITGNINNFITSSLNNIANRYIKFVELDFGIDSYENNSNNLQTDFKISIRKRFLNDRLVINVDGKTSTEFGNKNGNAHTYLDNITVEYALTPKGQFKVKVYNKNDFDELVGSTGIKIGGALVFSKEFNGIRLGKRKKKRKKVKSEK